MELVGHKTREYSFLVGITQFPELSSVSYCWVAFCFFLKVACGFLIGSVLEWIELRCFAQGLSAVVMNSDLHMCSSGMCSRRPGIEEEDFCSVRWNHRWRRCPQQLHLMPLAFPAVCWVGACEAVHCGSSCEYVKPGCWSHLLLVLGSITFCLIH